MKTIKINEENNRQRIDKFLKEEFFSNEEVTRGEIIRQIKAGDITINGKTVKPSYILKEGDTVELPTINYQEKDQKLFPNKEVKFDIIYQDKDIIVINKPAGLQIHPSYKKETGTLVNGLLHHFPEIRNVHDETKDAWMRPGIVHRLDRDTSGVMVIAKNKISFLELKEIFKDRTLKKSYWAIVWKKFNHAEKSGVINKPLARAINYKKQVIAGKKTKTKIREAITEYKVIEEWADYSLVEVTPRTGRMHQIRVHFSSIGHPLVGDEKYKLKNIRPSKHFPRHMLHAKSLDFSLFGQNYHFEVQLPEDFQKLLIKNH